MTLYSYDWCLLSASDFYTYLLLDLWGAPCGSTNADHSYQAVLISHAWPTEVFKQSEHYQGALLQPFAFFRSREPREREVSPALPSAGRRSSKTLPRGFSLSQVKAGDSSNILKNLTSFFSRRLPMEEIQCMGYMGTCSTSGTTTATQQSWAERAKRSTVLILSLTQSRTGCPPSTAGSPWSRSDLDRSTSPRGRSSLEAPATPPPPRTQAPSTRLQASVATPPSSPTDPPSLARSDHPRWSTSHQCQQEEAEEEWDADHRVVRHLGLRASWLSRRPVRGRWQRWWEAEATSSGGREPCRQESTIATPTLSSGITGFSMDGCSARIFSLFGEPEYLDWIFLLLLTLLLLDPCVFVALNCFHLYRLWYIYAVIMNWQIKLISKCNIYTFGQFYKKFVQIQPCCL